MKGNRGILLLVIALVVGGLLVVYFSAKEGEKQPAFQETAKTEAEDTQVSSPDLQAPEEKLEDVFREGVVEGQPMTAEDECERLERELREFFSYLDTRDYVRELGIEGDTFTRFKEIVHVLSVHPPVPAGEGINYDRIIENIYHFYRVLSLKDLKLIRLIAEHEADAMEINLALFSRWLMSGDRCGQEEGLPPSWDTIYRYAGFMVNSIGGRAYLFRRETRLRLLLNYYCLLIVHEADKRKMNSFGIDIKPFLQPLAEEIENNQLLYFRREYAGKLIDVRNYYLRKRRAS
ncbi:MAG: hypothetical protein HWN71_06540 [Desulfobacterales bacterium]|nr:hypothetical protein [Desulfobacterales bacterium]